MTLTRRSLLRRGGATGLVAAMAGAAAAARADRFGGEPGASAMLVVLPLIRSDYVKAFKGPSGTDTPNLVTNLVREHGVAGNWVWWAFVLTCMSTVFFYARLWRRSGVP